MVVFFLKAIFVSNFVFFSVWGIALVSVAVISLLSVVGILTVPLMGFTRWFNTLLSFLVALAVGTLVGDALLHLLPHVSTHLTCIF